MATQFVNEAVATVSIGGVDKSFTSDTVTAVLIDDTTVIITKSQDSNVIVQGGTLEYTVTINNTGAETLNNVVFFDEIPTGLTYVAESFKVDDATETPGIMGQELTYTIATLPTGIITIKFEVTAD